MNMLAAKSTLISAQQLPLELQSLFQPIPCGHPATTGGISIEENREIRLLCSRPSEFKLGVSDGEKWQARNRFHWRVVVLLLAWPVAKLLVEFHYFFSL